MTNLTDRQLDASYAAEAELRRLGAAVVAEHEPGYVEPGMHGPAPAFDLAAIDRAVDRALESCSPNEAWRRACLLFPYVHSNVIAERVAAAVIDRQ